MFHLTLVCLCILKHFLEVPNGMTLMLSIVLEFNTVHFNVCGESLYGDDKLIVYLSYNQ